MIPAIDLRGGRCVRLLQGRRDAETVYGNDPVAVARAWEAAGASWLHVVDLDGAFAGRLENREIIRAIAAAVAVPVQVGGGIRDEATAEDLLGLGVARVIVGTAAATDPDLLARLVGRFGERVVVGIDCRDGMVAVRGWEAAAGETGIALGRRVGAMGVTRVVYTDIARDGTLRGPNVEATAGFCAATGLRVIASGGVGSLDDIRALKRLTPLGLEGVIVGKALYEGAFTLQEALAAGEDEDDAGEKDHPLP
ncbi:MAG: 1-(5-phosphoribosyl)-5-[(5-phosphoribosylamino)methylideneamino]imidazole-4-carboxamide isomerase [Bacillota bacterium]